MDQLEESSVEEKRDRRMVKGRSVIFGTDIDSVQYMRPGMGNRSARYVVQKGG